MLFNSNYRILAHSRVMREAFSSIGLIVGDHCFGPEPTIQFYKELFAEKNVSLPIKVIMWTEIDNICIEVFEKLLVDADIGRSINRLLYKRNKKWENVAYPVNLKTEDLAAEIETALKKVCYINRGTTHTIGCGKSWMSAVEISENVVKLVGQISAKHPGGLPNVKSVYLIPLNNLSVIIPIYVLGEYNTEKKRTKLKPTNN